MTDREAIQTALAYVPRWLEFQQGYMPFVGAQVAVRVEGELLLSHAVGMADIQNGVPLTTGHLFRIASHSKTFTGTACMQLVEQGRLRLDDPVSAYIPEIADSSMASVTVRELLAHGSGMIRDGDDCSFWSLQRPFPDRDELLKTICESGKVLEPNAHFKYSNIGYSLLGLIIEAASGLSYREYVQRNIVDRLGLKNTGPDLDEGRNDEYAKGYSSRAHGPERVQIEHIDTRAESAATGFFANAEDLSAYFQAHLEGDDRLLTDASRRRMRQVQWRISDEASYGLGLSITTVNGRQYFGHSGGYPGHITMSKLDIDRKLSISVLTNAADGPAATLVTGILHLIDVALDAKHETKTDVLPADRLRPFTASLADLGGLVDVVNLGGRLYQLNPALANPATEAVELKVVSDTELEAVGDKGFGGYGERMRYTFDDSGAVEWVRGVTGHRLVPAERFMLPAKVTRPA